ncbi:DUF4038 domain-containing protein [Isoptericola haloaureus]|uniref:DUF4038 domain-containing protein n=1 Tax=Isoptericola haloaureus TaxID=1542902 RepID=A0ABU7Z4V0_9MICO
MSSWNARRRLITAALVAVVVLGAAAVGVWLAVRDDANPQALRIEGEGPEVGSVPDDGGAPPGAPGVGTAWTVSADGRSFQDESGRPVLVRGDSPWSLLTDLSSEEIRDYLAAREEQGFNALLVSLLGATGNGGPSDSGATVDDVSPFLDGDVTRLNPEYWDHVHAAVAAASEHGVTMFLYPVDGWTIGTSFVPRSIDECRTYGAEVGARLADLSNIVWVTGGDYFPVTNEPEDGSDVDRCFDAVREGLDTAVERPFSIQLGYDKSVSTDNPFWRPRVDWNFVYTYFPTYRAVLDAVEAAPSIPAVMGEGNYEGENNQPETPPTTDETIRRQVLWAMTSGACGAFFGTDDWEFLPGWETRLDSSGAHAAATALDVVEEFAWWRLWPDTDDPLVTSGRGTLLTDDAPTDVLDNDYVTAALTPDGSQALVYVPSTRTITVDRARLAPDLRARWIDPASGVEAPAGDGPTYTTPGPNSDGATDWLLAFDGAA